MKKFDLQKALAGAPVITRDGREVKELCRFNTLDDEQKVHGVVNGDLYTWYDDGEYQYKKESLGDDKSDLFMKSTKKTYWINFYNNKDYDQPYVGRQTFDSEINAELNSNKGAIQVSFEVEE